MGRSLRLEESELKVPMSLADAELQQDGKPNVQPRLSQPTGWVPAPSFCPPPRVVASGVGGNLCQTLAPNVGASSSFCPPHVTKGAASFCPPPIPSVGVAGKVVPQ